MTQSTQSIAPPLFAWVKKTVRGESVGDFLMEEEATKGEFDKLERGPAWI
jgi:hypothetical protein